MALHNPSGLYQSQAPLNPLPYVNIALQQRARKQAREQAIDQYYQKLPDTINDKGVRDQEIPIINEYKNKIFEYGYKNKEALRKGDGAAQLGLQQLMREAQSVARESQDLGRRGLERGKMYLSKEGRWAVDDDEFMAAEEAESQPLYVVKDGQIIKNPTHNKMDMVGLLSNRPFDEKEFGKEIKDKVKYGTKIQTTNDPTNPLFDIVSEVPSLDESSKGKIYAFAAEKLHGNRRFEDFIKKKTPEQLAILGEVYKETFGKPAEDDEDFAAGYVISQLPIQSTKQKRPQDTDAVMDKRFKQAKIMEGIKQANRKELFGMREDAKAAGEEANDLWIDNYLNRIRQEAKASGKVTTYKFGDGRTVTGYPVPLDPVLSKAVGFDDKNKGMLMVTDEGKYVPIFYETDANYAPIEKNGTYVVDKTKTNILSQDAIKLALGGKTGVKQLNKEMTKPSQKTKPKKDPLGLF